MKYFVLAGEASGDKQAALLCEAIIRHDPSAQIIGWGGEAMQSAGVQVTKHYRELAFMGFTEVVRHLPKILRNIALCKKEILTFSPDALILVDYPGFNLRIARWAHRYGLNTYYYISPQLWAWHTSRVYGIRQAVRKMYVILPFEQEFYRTYGMDVMYIGHPLAVEISKQNDFQYRPEKGRIALLPGSRKHEVDRILPVMVELIRKMPGTKFTVAAVPHLPSALYAKWLEGLSGVDVIVGDMKAALAGAEAAVVTSGTATLETALLGIPEVVVYKGSPLSFQIAKRLIKVKYISLVNLIMDKPLVPELIQADCNADKIKEQLLHILTPEVSAGISSDYKHLRNLLISGSGAEAAAIDIFSDISSPNQEHGQV